MYATSAKPRDRTSARRLALPGLLALGLMLGGCITAGTPQRKVTLPEPPKQAELAPAVAREHQRILAAYNGTYQDARLEGLIKQTVDRLVAASERPAQRYRITVLNSPSGNAFPLSPQGGEGLR